MSENIYYYTNELRKFMFENVYLREEANIQEKKAKYIIKQLYNYYIIIRSDLIGVILWI